MCQPAGGGDSPLETIQRHLLPLLGKYDLFVLLDNSSALSNQPWVHEMIRDLQPREVDFQDTVKAEWEWLSRIEGVACMAKLGFYQARRLRKCWNMVRQRERQTGVNYTHLVRVRPDLRIPRTLGQMLSQAASFYDEELTRLSELVTRLINPVLMLIMGLVIGTVVVLMYLPIFQLVEQVQ